MGNCFSSAAAVTMPTPLVTERRSTEIATVEAEGESLPEGNQNQPSSTSTSALREPHGEDSIICGRCHRPCGYTNGRYYLKCLQCRNFNICPRCYYLGFYHNVHAYAFVNNEDRHKFMERFAHHMGGWPILSRVLSAEPTKSLHPLKCRNVTVVDNLHPKMCPNPISWICLQCHSTFALCDSCIWLPLQHTRHVFATASTENLQKFIASLNNSGALPLSSTFVSDDAYRGQFGKVAEQL